MLSVRPIFYGSTATLQPGASIITMPTGGTFTPGAGSTAALIAFSGDVDGIRVTDGSGDQVSALTDNQLLDITAYSSNIDSNLVPIMVAALYTPEGRMVKLWGFTGAAGSGETSGSVKLPEGAQGCHLKVFYMSGSSGCTPLCDSYRVG